MTLIQIIVELQKEKGRAYATMTQTRSHVQSAEAQGRHHAYGYALQLLNEYQLEIQERNTESV